MAAQDDKHRISMLSLNIELLLLLTALSCRVKVLLRVKLKLE